MIKHILRRHTIPLVAWTILWALFFGAFLLGRERLSAGDLTGQFHAFGLFQSRSMSFRQLPVWSPGSYGGFPFAADPQSAVFYPPRWLTILLSPSAELPFPLIQLEILLHVWLAGTLIYALVFALTRRQEAGLLSAVAFGLGGYLTGYPLLQMAILETMTWLPGALLAIHMAFNSKRPALWLLVAGLFLALAALAGHPQTLMHAAYLAAAYYLFRALMARWPWQRVLAAGALVALTALGVSAVSWFPALRYTAHTVRSQVDYGFVSGGLPVADWVQLLIPNTLSLWAPQYGGLATVALAAAAWGLCRQGTRRAEVLFWSGAAFFSAWLALGNLGVLFRLAYYLVPGLGLFRQQERFLGLFATSLSLLAGLGLAAWLQASPKSRQRIWVGIVRFLIGGCIIAFLLLMLWLGWMGDWWSVFWRQSLLALFVLGLLRITRYRRAIATLLIVLLAADLYLVSLSTIMRRPNDGNMLWSSPDWVATLRGDQDPFRVDLGHFVHANWGEVYGIESVSGISPLVPHFLDQLQHLPRERFWQLLNVRHIISTEPLERADTTLIRHIPAGTVLNQMAEAWSYDFAAALPRAYMVYQAEFVADREQALVRLAAPDWDPTRSVILATQAADKSIALVTPERAPMTNTRRVDARTLEIDIETMAPGYLVMSEWDLPGWQAELDGVRVETLPANYAFQALYIPSGSHRIRFRYGAPDVVVGGMVSLACLVLSLGVAVLWQPDTRPVRFSDHHRNLRLPPLRLPDLPFVTSRQEILFVATLALMALGLRLYALGAAELTSDQARIYLIAAGLWRSDGIQTTGLYPLLLRAWSALFGQGEFALRLPSVLAGVLLVPVSWHLGRRIAGLWTGLGLAALVGFSPLLVAASQTVDARFGLGALLLTLATLQLLHAVDSAHIRNWLGYIVCLMLALVIWPQSVWGLASHGVYLLVLGFIHRRWRLIACWSFGGLLVLIACWILPGSVFGLAPQRLGAASASEFVRYITRGMGQLAVGPVWPADFLAVQGLGALLLIAWASRDLWRRRELSVVLFVGWLAAVLGGQFLLRSWSLSYRHEGLLLAAPAFWGLLILMLRRLWSTRCNHMRGLAIGVAAVLIALNGVGLARYYDDSGPRHLPDYRTLSTVLTGEARPGDLLISTARDPRLRYYLRDVFVDHMVLSPSVVSEEQDAAQLLELLSGGYSRVWFVRQNDGISSDENVAAWLARHAPLEKRLVGHALTIETYALAASERDTIRPLGIGYGEITLNRICLLINGHPVDPVHSRITLQAGDQIDLYLLWQASDPPMRSLTVFVHMLDAEGHLVTQHDGIPVQGLQPTTLWQAGDLIIDRHTLVVPEEAMSSPGQIRVGLYESETLERQLSDDGREAIELYTVLIKAE